jgi:thiamine biosynthesis lipoprotein
MFKTAERIANRQEQTFFALCTINAIAAYGRNSRQAIDLAVKRVAEIDDRMSAFKYDSDVSRINRSAGQKAQKISRDTLEVLKLSLEFSRLSKGAFDVTVRPLTALWGIGKKNDFIPPKEEIEQILPLVNFNDIVLDEENSSAFLKNRGQAIDLGGIAKGYAADEVKRILESYGVENALINLGGNIIALGTKPDGSEWRVGVQNPMSVRGEYVGTLKTVNKTVVTSGSNEQFFIKDGLRYHHIIDPRTGFPVKNELLSVTAVCDSSAAADALTTALFVLGSADALPLLKLTESEAIFITQDLSVLVTEGLLNSFERNF